MKFVHIGDLHIGKSLGEYDLYDDQRYILDQIVKISADEKVDGILIAGDVYDKSIPSETAVNLFDYFIRKLVGENIKVFIISGNHDSDERLGFGASLFEKNGVYISTKYDGNIKSYSFDDENGKVNVFLLPFIKSSYVKHYYPDEEIKTYNDAIDVAIKNTKINKNERNIMVAHQFVTSKSEAPKIAGSEGLLVINVGTVEQAYNDVFKDFDYTALGHIHSPQKIGKENIRYSGSILKYSLSEAKSEKSLTVIDLKDKNNIDIKQVILEPKRDLRHIKGELKKLLNKENIKNPDDFIYVTLTDEDLIENAIGIVREYYPNVVKLDYDNSKTKEIKGFEIDNISEEKTFKEIISDFYNIIYGDEISEDEMKILKEIAERAGILNETN